MTVVRKNTSQPFSEKAISHNRGAGAPPAFLEQAGRRPSPLSKLALFCSVKCPGKLVLEAYDTCRQLRETAITVIGGFHSPMEQECLRILLRGKSPVIWCLARGKLARTPHTFTEPVATGCLTIHATFPDNVRRVTTATSTKRNRIVADMADAVFVAHAAPGSKIESLALELLAAEKTVCTLDHPANATLIRAGASPIKPDTDLNPLFADYRRPVPYGEKA
jgi:predicted Rossmann fold nucleotide-binding protein DprA/Smf involved in DNA uptake